jgi:hypothetical protein
VSLSTTELDALHEALQQLCRGFGHRTRRGYGSHKDRLKRPCGPRGSSSIGPVAATVVKPNSYHGAVCSSRLLSAPHVATEIVEVIFGNQSNEPGIDPRCRLSLDLLCPRKSPPRRPPFDFALQEGNGLVSFHAGARRVVRSFPRVTSNCSGYAEDHHDTAKGSRETVHSNARSMKLCAECRARSEGASPGEVLDLDDGYAFLKEQGEGRMSSRSRTISARCCGARLNRSW